MKTYDNNGELIGEMNTIFAQDGSAIRTNTTHTTGCPIVQKRHCARHAGERSDDKCDWWEDSALIGKIGVVRKRSANRRETIWNVHIRPQVGDMQPRVNVLYKVGLPVTRPEIQTSYFRCECYRS